MKWEWLHFNYDWYFLLPIDSLTCCSGLYMDRLHFLLENNLKSFFCISFSRQVICSFLLKRQLWPFMTVLCIQFANDHFILSWKWEILYITFCYRIVWMWKRRKDLRMFWRVFLQVMKSEKNTWTDPLVACIVKQISGTNWWNLDSLQSYLEHLAMYFVLVN